MTAAINRLLLVLWCAAPSRWFRKGGGANENARAFQRKPEHPEQA